MKFTRQCILQKHLRSDIMKTVTAFTVHREKRSYAETNNTLEKSYISKDLCAQKVRKTSLFFESYNFLTGKTPCC